MTRPLRTMLSHPFVIRSWAVLFALTLCTIAVSAYAITQDPVSTGEELSRLVVRFEEPFIRTSATSDAEDTRLLAVIKNYFSHAEGDFLSELESFLNDFPNSGWQVAVLTNLGLSYYREGYFSRSIGAYERAWTTGRFLTDPKAKALVDRAVGELLKMHARLGHADELERLLADIGDRPLSGPATELLTGAREGLWDMRNNWGIAYLCGPKALKNLLSYLGFSTERIGFLDDVRSGPARVTHNSRPKVGSTMR